MSPALAVGIRPTVGGLQAVDRKGLNPEPQWKSGEGYTAPDPAPGIRFPGPESAEAPVPHQHHPAPSQLRCSAGQVRRVCVCVCVCVPAAPPDVASPSCSHSQFAGRWLLVAVASACRYLQEQGHRAEATALHATPQVAAMAVSTFRKLDGICWQVRQLYGDTGVPGRFLVPARGARGSVHVVVAETDYRDFAILYLERAQQLSMKLYARSLPVGDSALSVFEQRVRQANLTEDQTLFFPMYGFCESTDQFHVLNEAS